MHWNHRVLRTVHPLYGMSYAVHECYYTQPYDRIPSSWSETPEPAVADTPEELRNTLKLMRRAAKYPVLAEYNDKLVEVEG